MELSDKEMSLLKAVLHPLYKTAKKEEGKDTYRCHVAGITRDDLSMLISIHDRIVNEELDRDSGLSDYSEDFQNAIRYVRDRMDEDTKAILIAEANQCWNNHIVPGENVMDCSSLIGLLEEYGEYSDLDERWWESEADVSEIIGFL